MDPKRWRQIDELFQEVMACAPLERPRLLRRRCVGDADLRCEVETLLVAHERASSMLEWPLLKPAGGSNMAVEPAPTAGSIIGHYRLGRLIGAGGMGAVYEAVQTNPRRTVAIKLVRAMPCLDAWTARIFRREGQALARLQHPGIAAIHEAGQSAEGWHYFAMERVVGEPLTQYARNQDLSIDNTLELFGRICDAVHYAHQRGVIHRDLKPSNILVTNDGQPKILDFGLARIVDPDADLTQLTQPGTFHGTLAYASPEQAGGRSNDIDARSDVYSLGVILYELLTGQLPYELDGLALPEAARVICEQTPRPASAMRRELRGDLETIAGKALEKDFTRRYASAAALGDDIARYRNHQPILAHPPSTAYQIRKLVSRHRLPFALGGALVVAVIGSAIVTGWLAFHFARQRDLARNSQLRESESRDAAEEFATLLETLFREAQLGGTTAKGPSLRVVLDKGYERLDQTRHPLVRARLMTVMGGAYAGLDELPRARDLLEQAVAIRRAELGGQHLDLAESLIQLAVLRGRMGQTDGADAAAAEAVAIRTGALRPDHALVAGAWKERGAIQYYAGNHAAAIEDFSKALDIHRRLFGSASPQVAEDLSDLGYALVFSNRLDEAEPIVQESLALRRKLGDRSALFWSMEAMARLIWNRGDTCGSERLYAEELELARAEFEPRHPQLAWIIRNYAYTVEHNQGLAEAEPLFREAVQIHRDAGNDGHRELAASLKMLGRNLVRQQKYVDALPLLGEAADIFLEVVGPDARETMDTLALLEEARHRNWPGTVE